MSNSKLEGSWYEKKIAGILIEVEYHEDYINSISLIKDIKGDDYTLECQDICSFTSDENNAYLYAEEHLELEPFKVHPDTVKRINQWLIEEDHY